MVWCGVVWCGVVWCGVVWCGVVWCGMVWCGVVWYHYQRIQRRAGKRAAKQLKENHEGKPVQNPKKFKEV